MRRVPQVRSVAQPRPDFISLIDAFSLPARRLKVSSLHTPPAPLNSRPAALDSMRQVHSMQVLSGLAFPQLPQPSWTLTSIYSAGAALLSVPIVRFPSEAAQNERGLT